MRHQFANTLLSAVGASQVFVEDVLGDLEEIATQRRDAAEPCGALWYAGQVCRLVPYAIRDGVRGSAAAAVVDVTQKAIAAWLLLAIASLSVLLILNLVFFFDIWSGRTTTLGQTSLESEAFVVALLLAVTLRYPMLGYVTVWVDSKRPLITLLTMATIDACLYARFFGDDPFGPETVAKAAFAWSLIMVGGVWRLRRGQDTRAAFRHAAADETR
jgi:hypothetical protein